MTWKIKTLLAIIVVVVVSALMFIVKTQYDIIQNQKTIEQTVVEFKRFKDGTARSESKFATREDIEKIIKKSFDLKDLKKDLGLFDAKIVGVVTTTANSRGFVGNNIGSTTTTVNPDPVNTSLECGDEKLECPNSQYLKNRQQLSLSENFDNVTVPVGEVGFSAWKDKPWDLSIKPRKYTSTTVLSTNEDGRHFAHNKLILEVEGKQYTVPISDSQLREVLPEKKFRFSPRIYMSADGGFIMTQPPKGEFVPNAQISMFSYGKTKPDPDWTFLGIGVGYETNNESVNLMLSPINYNVGHHIPLINNMHVGPSISYDFEKNVGLFMGVRVGL